MKNYDVIVIGGGPAGLSAAFEASKSELKVLLIERDKCLGGILNQCIHTGFGVQIFKEELTGPEYAERYIDLIEQSNADVLLNSMVVEIDKVDRKITVMSEYHGRLTFTYTALILAMGCRERSRGSVIIPGTRPAGVFTAGSAQYYTNIMGDKIGENIFILGSGDIGLIMARRMTLEGSKVLGVAEIQSFSSGLNRNIVQCLEDFEIPLYLNHTVVEIHGDTRIEGVTISKVDENYKPIEGTQQYISCDTLLLSVGLIPENELTRAAGISIDGKTKGPVINQEMETNVKGIFACGNVAQVHDLVDFVTLEGARAGRNALKYVLRYFQNRNLTIEKESESRKELNQEIGINISNQFLMVSPQVLKRELLDVSQEDFQVMLRVSNPMEKGKIIMYVDGVKFKQFDKKFLTPGESIHLKLSLSTLPNTANNLMFELTEV